jgi:hypothetical protein
MDNSELTASGEQTLHGSIILVSLPACFKDWALKQTAFF